MGELRLESQFEDWVQIKGMITYAISCLSMGASVEILRDALKVAMTEYEDKWVRPLEEGKRSPSVSETSSKVTEVILDSGEKASMKKSGNKVVIDIAEAGVASSNQSMPISEAKSNTDRVSSASFASSKKEKSMVDESVSAIKSSHKKDSSKKSAVSEGSIPSGRFKTGLIDAAVSSGVFDKNVPKAEVKGQLTFSDIATSETQSKQSIAKAGSASKPVIQNIEAKKPKSEPIVENNPIEVDKPSPIKVEKPAVENVQTSKPVTITQSKSSSSLLQYFDGGITEEEKQALDKARRGTNYLNADDKLNQTSALRRGRILNTTLLSRFYLLRSGGTESKVCIRIEVNVDSSRQFGDTVVWRVLSGSVLSGVSPVRNYSDEYRNIRGGLLKTYGEVVDDSKYYVVNKTTDWFSSSALWMGVILLGNMNSLATRLSVVTSTTNKDAYNECKKAVG